MSFVSLRCVLLVYSCLFLVYVMYVRYFKNVLLLQGGWGGNAVAVCVLCVAFNKLFSYKVIESTFVELHVTVISI